MAGFATGFGYLSSKISSDFSGQVALGCITFIGGIWLAFWNMRKAREKEAESRIFSQKAEAYEALVTILRDLFMASKGWAPSTEAAEVAKSLMVIRYKMIVWGGQATIRAISALEAVPPGNPGAQFLAVSDLYAAIRADLGHQDDPSLAEDLFLTQITEEDKASVRTMLHEARGRRGKSPQAA
jgi:cbb3-type cytochrome oxidase subunit 3